MNGTKTEKKVVDRIAEVELSVLSFVKFLQAPFVDPVKRLSLSRLIEEPRRQGVLTKVSDDMVKKLFDFSILRLIDRIGVDQNLTFVAGARLCEFDRYGPGLHDFFAYEYKTRTLSRVSGSAPLLRKLTDGTKEKVDETESIRPVYQEQFDPCGMPFEFAKAAWLHYLEKKIDFFGIPSLGAQDALLENRSVPACCGRRPTTSICFCSRG